MPRPLPSLNALRAFEAAGRHLSFSRAAAELSVTPAAVGQRVKALEDQLGAALFVRRNRGIELTEAGQALLPGLTDGFERLVEGVEWFRRRQARRPLTVTVEPTLAGRWLVKRLERFNERHPGIAIRLDASNRVVDFFREQVDVGVRYGNGEYPGLRVDRLFGEIVFPVCSPRLLAGPHPLREPADLRWHTLLHCDWNPRHPTWPDWGMWLKAVGLDGIAVDSGPQFSIESYDLMLDAAVAGQGVALASGVAVADEIAAGGLVRPFDVDITLDFAYFVVAPEATADSPRIAAFREWLLAEAAQTETELAPPPAR